MRGICCPHLAPAGCGQGHYLRVNKSYFSNGLKHFGQPPSPDAGTFAAAFDPFNGDYYIRRDGGSPRGLVQKITAATISGLVGSNAPLTSSISIQNVVSKSQLEAW